MEEKELCEDEVEDESVNIVLVPREKHGENKCHQAKLDEIKELKDFKAYNEVEEKGQYRSLQHGYHG